DMPIVCNMMFDEMDTYDIDMLHNKSYETLEQFALHVDLNEDIVCNWYTKSYQMDQLNALAAVAADAPPSPVNVDWDAALGASTSYISPISSGKGAGKG